MSNQNEALTEEQIKEKAFQDAFKAYKVPSDKLKEMKGQLEDIPSYEEEDDIPFDISRKETNQSQEPIDDEIAQELRKQKKEKNTPSNNDKPNSEKPETPETPVNNQNEEEKPLSRKELQEFFKQQREEEARLKKSEEERIANEQEQQKLIQEQEELLKQSSLNSFDTSKIHNDDEKKRMKDIVTSFGPELEEYVNLRIKEVIEMLKHTEANTKQFANQGLTKAEKAVYDKLNTENDFKSQKEFFSYIQQEKAEENYKKVINEIKTEHNDYEPNGELEQKMVGWVNTLQNQKYQGYLASLYQSTDPKDHILLYNEFKEANNIPKKKEESKKPNQAPQKTAQELDAERRQKAFASQPSKSSGSDVADRDLSFEERFKKYKVKVL